MSLFKVYGTTVENNTSYPAIEMSISAKALTLFNPADGSTKDIVAPAGMPMNCAINSSGAGYRDAATAYSAGDVVWFYWIWGSAPGLTTINSKTDPASGGPVLPSGYTHYAPVFPVVIQAGGALPSNIRVAGNELFYVNPSYVSVITNPTYGTTYSQSYASLIPACAATYKAEFVGECSYQSGVYGAQGGVVIQAVNGCNFINLSLYTPAVTYATNSNSVVADCPLDPSMTFKCVFLLNTGTFNPANWPNLGVFFLGYKFPYGG